MHHLFVITALVLLAACSQKPGVSTKAEPPATFADPQIQAYDKAQEVQGIVNTAEQQQQQQMQEEGL